MNKFQESSVPSFWWRIYCIWLRYLKVYKNNIFSNATPPFVEPLLFLLAVGLGLGSYIQNMEGMPYLQFLASGLLITTAMFTAAFECSYGTFIRMEFEKVYDGLLAAPITVRDLFIGEIIWAGTKGFIFSTAVLCVVTVFGVIRTPYSLLVPFAGFVTGVMIACLALVITSFVKTINHFTFFFSGIVTPMFFFSGVVFPTSRLPVIVQPLVEALPLRHTVRLVRAACTETFSAMLWLDVAYCLLFCLIMGYLAIYLLKRRIIK